MKKLKLLLLLALAAPLLPAAAEVELIGKNYTGCVPPEIQARAALGTYARLIGEERASQFTIQIVPGEGEADYFEIAPAGDGIQVTAANGVSACRALKWYLNNVCCASVSWNGDNTSSLPAALPADFASHRETTPYKYRYIFNNCVFGYTAAFWHWSDWERIIDVLAYNGINMPAMLLGQEKVWQETYKSIGVPAEELNDFFAGPAWFPWQWMGNLDGWGGPLSQAFIDKQCELQKQILARCRSLGMTPVQTGFSGHIPAALVRMFPDLKYGTMEWAGFGPTYILNWQDPLFPKISSAFLKIQNEIYGTDHYYNIDPFNEMAPPSYEKEYIVNMADAICRSMLEGDPDGVWVLMTWFAKHRSTEGWNTERTKNFFDAIPDDHLIALELWGEHWNGTGWHWQHGWYGKPWVWCILQSFGCRTDIYGGLEEIFNNYHTMLSSPDHGNLQGAGVMTEGLDINTVVYDLMFDLMWGDGVKDLDAFKRQFLRERYGRDVPEQLVEAWDIIYSDRYTSTGLLDMSKLSYPPTAGSKAGYSIFRMKEAWRLMLEVADQMKGNQAYVFDLVNVGREVMSQLSDNYINDVETAYRRGDRAALEKAGEELQEFIADFDELMGTEEHFLLGKWLEDARKWASTPEEEKQLEWSAKRQITDWGGHIGYYAAKEWSGMGTRAAKEWEYYVQARLDALENGGRLDPEYQAKLKAIYEDWTHTGSKLPAVAVGDPVEVSRRMYNLYGPVINRYEKSSEIGGLVLQRKLAGAAKGKPVTATGHEDGNQPYRAVDGQIDSTRGWWAKAPASLTVDLEEECEVAAIWVITYWNDLRYYQYTVEVSPDGENWEQVVDLSENMEYATSFGIMSELGEPVKVRYVRLNMLRNSANPSTHVVELKVLTPADLAQYKAEL